MQGWIKLGLKLLGVGPQEPLVGSRQVLRPKFLDQKAANCFHGSGGFLGVCAWMLDEALQQGMQGRPRTRKAQEAAVHPFVEGPIAPSQKVGRRDGVAHEFRLCQASGHAFSSLKAAGQIVLAGLSQARASGFEFSEADRFGIVGE